MTFLCPGFHKASTASGRMMHAYPFMNTTAKHRMTQHPHQILNYATSSPKLNHKTHLPNPESRTILAKNRITQYCGQPPNYATCLPDTKLRNTTAKHRITQLHTGQRITQNLGQTPRQATFLPNNELRNPTAKYKNMAGQSKVEGMYEVMSDRKTFVKFHL